MFLRCCVVTAWFDDISIVNDDNHDNDDDDDESADYNRIWIVDDICILISGKRS